MPNDTIYRHWFPALIYTLIGGGVMGVLLFAVWFGFVPDPFLQLLSFAMVVLVGIVTSVLIYVYQLAHIALDEQGVSVINYESLFARKVSSADWSQVQDITVRQSGIFSNVFGYGDLLIQTASEIPNIGLKYVAQALIWKEVIDQRAQGVGNV